MQAANSNNLTFPVVGLVRAPGNSGIGLGVTPRPRKLK